MTLNQRADAISFSTLVLTLLTSTLGSRAM